MLNNIHQKVLSIFIIIALVFSSSINLSADFVYAAEKEMSKAEKMEWAKDPGLGVKELHVQGYTGKGVNIACIGQPFGDIHHEELESIDVHYDQSIALKYGLEKGERDLPGRANISVLAGKTVGICPDATIYYIANPTVERNQNIDAECLRKIISINKKLPKDKKFKVVYMGTYWQELSPNKKGYSNLKKALEEARNEGIYPIFCYDFECAMSKNIGGDRQAPLTFDFSDNNLYFPSDMTTADMENGYYSFIKRGDRSMPALYTIGMMALAWQINPNLSTEKLLGMMKATAYKYDAVSKGGLINPKAFMDEVNRATKNPKTYSLKDAPKNIVYDDNELLEWAKNPGLGIRDLQSQGYTGEGAVVGYIDQPLGEQLHNELRGIDLHYNTQILDKYNARKDASMHGPSVLSLIAGKTIGVAPKATVYYYAVPAGSKNHIHEADAIRLAIKQNKNLPDSKKIKVIGISDNIAEDPKERKKNADELKKAISEAQKAGIFVTLCGEYGTLNCSPMTDVDKEVNYNITTSPGHSKNYEENVLYVPTFRTTAKFSGGYEEPDLASLSWASPYVVGLVALGLQVNPKLTATELVQLMKETAYHRNQVKSGGIANPKAYIDAVNKTTDQKKAKDYKIFLYNSHSITNEELDQIKKYVAKSCGKSYLAQYIDVKGMKDASTVYEAMKHVQAEMEGKIAGVQIFGTDEDVPAFNLEYKVQMTSDIHEGDSFKSDYFYGNLNNAPADLEGISAYKLFKESMPVDFVPQWPVVRLAISSGDYDKYFNKYDDYQKKTKKTKTNRLACFSSPIFATDFHTDDMGWFIKYRMDKKYGFIKSSKYSLYGNKKGDFPIGTKVKGDFNASNLKKENAIGITDIIINSHGQWNNFDRCVYVNEKEKRESILNTNNINTVLGKNYYNLMAISCSNAEGISNQNITYKALTGKAINVFSATTVMSMNGANVKDSLDELKKNNLYYFYYTYFRQHYKLGKSMTESFYQAQRAYAKSVAANSHRLIGDANYQFQLCNLLGYEHFGLL